MRCSGGGSAFARFRGRLLVLVVLFGASAFAQDDQPIRPWIDKASAAFDSGDFATAEAVAEAGLEADGGDSDLLYLLAKSDYALAGRVPQALEDVEAALESDRFDRYQRDQAIVFDADLLIRLRRWDDALSALKGLRNQVDVDGTYERARALLSLGDISSALDVFDRARRVWPSDLRFARLFFESRGIPSDDRTRRLAAAFVRSATDGNFEDPALTALSLPFIPDPSVSKNILRALRAARGPVATLEALHYGLLDGPSAVDEFFAQSGGKVSRSDLERLVALCGPKGLEALAAHLASFSGTLTEDADGDGIVDATTVYKDGQATEWDLDADQDGLSEIVIRFAYGMPASAVWQPSSARFTYTWGNWPVLSAASLDSVPAGGLAFAVAAPAKTAPTASMPPTRDWRLADGVLAWAPIRLEPFPDAASSFELVARTGSEPPTDRALTVDATRLTLHRKDGDLAIDLRDGIALQGELTSAGRTVARFTYDKGRPVLEMLDQDGDGRFESKLFLDPTSDPADPLVLSYESDIDGDGIYEYKEELVPPYRRTWDLDLGPATRSDR